MAKEHTITLAEDKYLIPVGMGFDIATGTVVIGVNGESIINGGMSGIIGIFSAGNNYKSTIAHGLALRVMKWVRETTKNASTYHLFDSESNVYLSGYERLIPDELLESDFAINTGDDNGWLITTASDTPMETWIPNFLDNVLSGKQKKIVYECFTPRLRNGSKEVTRPAPLVGCIDSLSALSTEGRYDSSMELIKGTGGEITNMREGLIKFTLLNMLPAKVMSNNAVMFLTSHVGVKSGVNKGPAFMNRPTKSLQYMGSDVELKGTGKGLNYLASMLLEPLMSKTLTVQGTTDVLYPNADKDDSPNDLQLVAVKYHRNKAGSSGLVLPIVILQSKGIQKELTEFHTLVINKRFGMSDGKYYDLDLYPAARILRTTIREQIDNDKKLCRAIEITAELLQIKTAMLNLRAKFPDGVERKKLWCTPAELYEWFTQNDYDWNMILSTRGYYVMNQYSHPIPFLSTIDLLKVRAGIYTPYFMDDKKNVLPKYKNKRFNF